MSWQKLQTELGNDVLGGSKVSITALGGNKTQLDDFIYGDDGDDTIYGRDGSDHLSGRDDKDELVGGSGADFFDCGSGLDVVKDFNATEGDVYMPL
jgi:Ca2+-binding RTX toxin-like protein